VNPEWGARLSLYPLGGRGLLPGGSQIDDQLDGVPIHPEPQAEAGRSVEARAGLPIASAGCKRVRARSAGSKGPNLLIFNPRCMSKGCVSTAYRLEVMLVEVGPECATMLSNEGSFDAKAFLASVGVGRSITKPRTGEVIFSQGDPADALFYIQEGKVKVTTLSSHGKEAVVAILSAGDFFGEGCLAGQPLRISTVAAIADSNIARLAKAAVVRVMHDEPAFSELFIEHLLARNIRMEADLIDQRSSIQVRNGLRASFCFSPISARTGRLSRWWPRSARRCLPR
jgi:CRP-like cAMP-binding protein